MKILVVVDMQNDFIDGALGTSEAVAIVDKVADKIKAYREAGDVVIFTRDTHYDNYLNTQEGKRLPVPHCIKGSEGWEISKELEVLDAEIIDKPTFGSQRLAGYIKENYKPEEIELVGLCTDICVISNAIILKSVFLETTVTVDNACCAGVTPESHMHAIETMKMCQVNVING